MEDRAQGDIEALLRRVGVEAQGDEIDRGAGEVARRGGGADGPVLDVDAGVLLAVVESRLAAGDDLPVEPLYLRRPDALTLAERGVR